MVCSTCGAAFEVQSLRSKEGRPSIGMGLFALRIMMCNSLNNARVLPLEARDTGL